MTLISVLFYPLVKLRGERERAAAGEIKIKCQTQIDGHKKYERVRRTIFNNLVKKTTAQLVVQPGVGAASAETVYN